MPRDINRIDGNPPVIQREAADQIAPHPARGPDHQADRGATGNRGTCRAPASVAASAPRSDRGPANHTLPLQFFQGLRDHPVLFHQFGLHRDDLHPGPQPGPQFLAADGLGNEIIGPGFQPIGNFDVSDFEVSRMKYPYPSRGSARNRLQNSTPVMPGIIQSLITTSTATAEHSASASSAEADCITIPPAAQIHGQKLPLGTAVIHHQHRAGRPGGSLARWPCCLGF